MANKKKMKKEKKKKINKYAEADLCQAEGML